MTAQNKIDTHNEFSLQDLSLSAEEAANKAVDLGWFGSFRSALQAVSMARGTLKPDARVERDGQIWTRTI